jgi:hypothetical protein
MPPFVKSAEFWKAVCLITAALVTYFLPQYALTADSILAVIYALLKLFFNVVPELRARGLM